MQRVGEPAQRVLQVRAFALSDTVDGRLPTLGGLDDSGLQREQRLEVPLEGLRQVLQHPGQPGPHRGSVGFVAGGVVELTIQPAQQHLLFGDGQLRVDRGPARRRQAAGGACAAQPLGAELHAIGLVVAGAAVLGERDLVGQRGQVDLVGLLVQVVALGQVLLLEVVSDAGRLAVLMAGLRCLAGLFGERERFQVTGVGEIVVGVGVTVALVVRAHTHQREECVEDLVEHRLVAMVLDQGHAQRGAQHGPRRQHPGLGGAAHRIQRFGDGHPHSGQPQQPDESVQGRLHGYRVRIVREPAGGPKTPSARPARSSSGCRSSRR